MIELKNEKGSVFVSDTALSSITGAAATSCFGVKGMAYRSMTVCQAIIGQVRYLVTENTGAVVRGVNVCVDSMTM